MLKKFIIIISLLVSVDVFAADSLTMTWNSKEGIERLNHSQYKNDFYQIADHFQPQINPLYCAVASSVIILNTMSEGKEIPSQKELEVQKPKVLGDGRIAFNSYSQFTFLNDKTDQIKDRKIINLQNISEKTENDAKNFDAGISLKQLSDILHEAYKLKAKITYAKTNDEQSINKFRDIVKEVVSDNKRYLLVNFNGKILNLKTGGHMSPIVAYDQNSDSVLVMDVAGHKNGWYWVGVNDLYKAMNTLDGANYRGYLVIS
jgi:hypothetical protein